MSIDFSAATIHRLSLHQVGNPVQGGQFFPSAQPHRTDDVHINQLLQQYFFTPFKQEEFWHFSSGTGEPALNPVYLFVTTILNQTDADGFHEQSINIAKHLFNATQHPNIKEGELYVALIKNVMINEEQFDAVGLFKSEEKDWFIKTKRKSGGIELSGDEGVPVNKLDKGCIIINTQHESGYKVLITDKSGKSGAEASFWKDDFLQLKPLSSDYHHTNSIMQLTKAYVTQQLPEEFEVNRTDQIDLLNKSMEYFKSNTQFNAHDFAQTVFEDQQVIHSFTNFSNQMQQQTDLEVMDEFEINPYVVKKQSRIFKSILKLDKNFHVYIHGNREMIEKGVDENGRKYYKLYYDSEA